MGGFGQGTEVGFITGTEQIMKKTIMPQALSVSKTVIVISLLHNLGNKVYITVFCHIKSEIKQPNKQKTEIKLKTYTENQYR